jgi:COP9 signalosome complex subunit 7
MSVSSGGKILPYCLLAKGARPLAISDLIHKATADPGVFAFGELLDVPSVNEVDNFEVDKAFGLLADG